MFLFSLEIMDTCGKYGCHSDASTSMTPVDTRSTLKVCSGARFEPYPHAHVNK